MDLFGDLPPPGDESKLKSNDNISGEAGLKRKIEGDDVQKPKSAKIDTQVKYHLKGYVAERQGEREDMQDAFLLIDDITPEFTDLHPSIYRIAVYGVFDGHGGARASRFASQNLHKILQEKIPKVEYKQVEKDIKKLFIEVFKKTDEAFLKEATKVKPPWKDGSTVAFVLVLNETIFTANLGDSQVFLCREKEELGKCVPIHLTTVHNPSLYEERIRIQKAGGHVKEGRVMGVLEVSRSIGDGQYKKHGVTCTPDIKKCQLSDSDRYLVLACDGLWKTFSPDECLKTVNTILKDESLKEEADTTKNLQDIKFETACSKLANSAVLRLSSDNVTVLLVSISS